jgi:hypothetical protein
VGEPPASANAVLIFPDDLKEEFEIFIVHVIDKISKLFVNKHVAHV